MEAKQLIIDGLTSSRDMLKGTLKDFSDAELFVRPCPGANHTAWQLGHLIIAETYTLNQVAPGTGPKLPDGFTERFDQKTTSGIDDPAHFKTSKEQLMSLLDQARSGMIAWVKTLSNADLDKDSGTKWAPTLGSLANMQGAHMTMHLGQFQVIRRKLGKPILY